MHLKTTIENCSDNVLYHMNETVLNIIVPYPSPLLSFGMMMQRINDWIKTVAR